MNKKLAERLQELRKARGYSQEELADKLSVSRQAVSKWECGDAAPDTENLIALAGLYGCSIDAIVFGKVESKPENKEKVSENGKTDSKCIGIVSAVTVFASVIAYVLLGSLLGKWHPAWIVFFSIPLIPSLMESINKKDGRIFCFPVLVAAAYLLMGSLWGLWHPWWVLFLLIPLYYALFGIKNK